MSKSNGANKYLKNGAISPLWQEIEYQKACDKHDIDFATEMAKNITNALNQQGGFNFIGMPPEDYNDIYEGEPIIMRNTKQELEDRFEFLKNHMDNPEELELAKLVLQSYHS